MNMATVVGGLAFGDEGKGVVTDYLTRRYNADLVVRYNGGPQAAHNVVTDDGRHHTFSQFGAGALAGARTFLSKFMLIDPLALANEAAVLSGKGVAGPFNLVRIDPQCVVITHYHRAANRARERVRGSNRHGSVGLGVGEARMDELDGTALRFGDLGDKWRALSIIERIQARKLREFPRDYALMVEPHVVLSDLQRALAGCDLAASWHSVAQSARSIVFEGAQGFLLDETYGFAPYNTWTDCTFNNARVLASEVGINNLETVGVVRSYYTRHGAGPFPTEQPQWAHTERHNATHPWMGKFRCGYFDGSAFEYALEHNRPDYIAVTHLDGQFEQAIGTYGSIPIGGTKFVHGATPSYERCDVVDWIERQGCDVRVMFDGPTAGHAMNRELVRLAS